MLGQLDVLQSLLGWSFDDKELLVEALIHPSASNENPEKFPRSNQRLEFLGDSYISFVIANELFNRAPDMPEGALTELRAAVIRGDTLARVAHKLSLGKSLVMGHGEKSSGGENRSSNLAAALEAVVGAMVLDGGPSLAYEPTLKLLQYELDLSVETGVVRDPKNKLQEVAQSLGRGSPVYRLASTSLKEGRQIFVMEVLIDELVFGTGIGTRKLDGERSAAKEALDSLSTGQA